MNNDFIILNDFRPNRSDAVKNRALLLETARRLFDEHGVDAVSMSAIAEAAGVGKGTLYRHFTNKTDLCFGLLDHDQRLLQENTLEYLRTQAACPYDGLRWFLGQVVVYVDRSRKWIDQDANVGGPDLLSHPAHRWWRHTMRSLLEQIEFSGDVDYTADVLYVMTNVQAVEYQRDARGYSLERVIEGIQTTLDRLLCR